MLLEIGCQWAYESWHHAESGTVLKSHSFSFPRLPTKGFFPVHSPSLALCFWFLSPWVHFVSLGFMYQWMEPLEHTLCRVGSVWLRKVWVLSSLPCQPFILDFFLWLSRSVFVNTPQVAYPCTHRRMFGWFPVFGCYKPSYCSCTGLCVDVSFISLGSVLGLESQDPWRGSCRNLEWLDHSPSPLSEYEWVGHSPSRTPSVMPETASFSWTHLAPEGTACRPTGWWHA